MPIHAVAALESALLDLLGQHIGVPVAEIIGEKDRAASKIVGFAGLGVMARHLRAAGHCLLPRRSARFPRPTARSSGPRPNAPSFEVFRGITPRYSPKWPQESVEQLGEMPGKLKNTKDKLQQACGKLGETGASRQAGSVIASEA